VQEATTCAPTLTAISVHEHRPAEPRGQQPSDAMVLWSARRMRHAVARGKQGSGWRQRTLLAAQQAWERRAGLAASNTYMEPSQWMKCPTTSLLCLGLTVNGDLAAAGRAVPCRQEAMVLADATMVGAFLAAPIDAAGSSQQALPGSTCCRQPVPSRPTGSRGLPEDWVHWQVSSAPTPAPTYLLPPLIIASCA
jgi:hypothetical protein